MNWLSWTLECPQQTNFVYFWVDAELVYPPSFTLSSQFSCLGRSSKSSDSFDCIRYDLIHAKTVDFLPRDCTEGEKWSEAILSADNRQQMPLRGVDHPNGGMLGWGPCREAWLWPHQDLHGQTKQVRSIILLRTQSNTVFLPS